MTRVAVAKVVFLINYMIGSMCMLLTFFLCIPRVVMVAVAFYVMGIRLLKRYVSSSQNESKVECHYYLQPYSENILISLMILETITKLG